jgi:hypothetical protein
MTDLTDAIGRVLERCGGTNHDGQTVMRMLLEELTESAQLAAIAAAEEQRYVSCDSNLLRTGGYQPRRDAQKAAADVGEPDRLLTLVNQGIHIERQLRKELLMAQKTLGMFADERNWQGDTWMASSEPWKLARRTLTEGEP